MIEIALCTDDNYVMPTTVLITSIEYTNKEESIHYNIVSESLSEKSKEIFNNSIKNKTHSITFYSINSKELQKETSSTFKKENYVSIATYFRVNLPSILPNSINKVLYLDGDMIVTDKLLDLWNIDLETTDIASAAVIDIYNDDIRRYNRLHYTPISRGGGGYFNAGAMLINLNYWRKNKIQEKTLDFIKAHKDWIVAHDQDALNYILNGKVKYIHPKYNVQLDFFINDKNKLFINRDWFQQIQEAVFNPVIVHYTGDKKPWHKECIHPLKNIWLLFAKKSNIKKIKITNRYKGIKLLKHRLRKILNKLKLANYYNPFICENIKNIEQKINKFLY